MRQLEERLVMLTCILKGSSHQNPGTPPPQLLWSLLTESTSNMTVPKRKTQSTIILYKVKKFMLLPHTSAKRNQNNTSCVVILMTGLLQQGIPGGGL